MDVRWTRRAFLATTTAARVSAATRGDSFPSERVRFADEVTENEVFRMTASTHNSFLPPSSARSASSRNAFLLYASDRTGSLQAFRLDLRSGASQLLTEAVKLDPLSITLAADQKSFCYFDGNELKTAAMNGTRDRTIASADGQRVGGLSTSEDGLYAAFLTRSGNKTNLMIASVPKGGARTAAETASDAAGPLLRPKRDSVLYSAENGLWLASLDGTENRKLKIAGPAADYQWSPDGRTIFYLAANELREHTPDSNLDTRLAKTSQFAGFGRNADASVFVGASGSKASPLILLLLRVAQRELALCEHRASNPSAVNPIFSPSSQRIYFQSDRAGKSTIYSMVVDRLVEATET